MSQEQINKSEKTRNTSEESVQHIGEAAAATKEHKAELDHDIDDILSEIDGVLEENAEEFVRGYVQKGGQ